MARRQYLLLMLDYLVSDSFIANFPQSVLVNYYENHQ